MQQYACHLKYPPPLSSAISQKFPRANERGRGQVPPDDGDGECRFWRFSRVLLMAWWRPGWSGCTMELNLDTKH